MKPGSPSMPTPLHVRTLAKALDEADGPVVLHCGSANRVAALLAIKAAVLDGVSKEEALALAERLGVPAAAKELGLHESQLYGWRVKARADRDQSETERNQAAEIARLKRKVADQAEELAIVKKAAAYFAKSLK